VHIQNADLDATPLYRVRIGPLDSVDESDRLRRAWPLKVYPTPSWWSSSNMVRTSRLRIVLIVCGLLTPFPAFANPWNIPAPNLPARAFVLIEAQSGTELAAVNADERLPPASLTKLMTAYLLFGDLRAGKLKLDEHVTVSRYAAHLPGARMFLRDGEQVPAEELFKGMLVQSGNDATFALVEHVSGTLRYL